MERVYGIHAVAALLERRAASVRRLALQQGRKDGRIMTIRDLAARAGIEPETLPRRELDRLSDGAHQGVIAWIDAGESLHDLAWLLDWVTGAGQAPLLLVLDGVTDPHNFGACLRSADAAGVDAVLIAKDRSAPLTPVVRKVACGAADTVPIVQVTNLVRALRRLQQAGVWLVGAAGEGERSLFEADLAGPVALVLGAEGSGLRRLTRECCDLLVRIPMHGVVSSLNVSVATGVCLFEARRQRGG
jgi:23S rRNA (guanosine2251-2'-O)-methyltransferase